MFQKDKLKHKWNIEGDAHVKEPTNRTRIKTKSRVWEWVSTETSKIQLKSYPYGEMKWNLK